MSFSLLPFPYFFLQLMNPLDAALILSSSYYPLDLLILVSLLAYSLTCTLFALSQSGIRVLFMLLYRYLRYLGLIFLIILLTFAYRVKVQGTAPQGLLWLSFYLVLGLSAAMFEFMFLAPQYSTWGSQVLRHSDIYIYILSVT
jgi:hypothetical protein